MQFAVLGYAITSMETETYRPARLILLGEDASPQLRRSTSLDALVTPASPPFFVWHTAEDPYVVPEHTYRFASALAASRVPHAVHVFPTARTASGWPRAPGGPIRTTLADAWIHEQAARRDDLASHAGGGYRLPSLQPDVLAGQQPGITAGWEGAAPDDADEADHPVRRGRSGRAERGTAWRRRIGCARYRARTTPPRLFQPDQPCDGFHHF